MYCSMSTITLELRVLPDEPATPIATASAGRRPFRAVLAPLLPTLVLLALCIAGPSDPPPTSAEAPGDLGGQSRLHVPSEAPHLPAVPRFR